MRKKTPKKCKDKCEKRKTQKKCEETCVVLPCFCLFFAIAIRFAIRIQMLTAA